MAREIEHVDQAKGQQEAGEATAVIYFESTIPTQQRPELPLIFQPCCPVSFLNTSASQERTEPARTKDRVGGVKMAE